MSILDGAWDAMVTEVENVYTPSTYWLGDIFARHRPLIEAAVLREVRERVEAEHRRSGDFSNLPCHALATLTEPES